MEKSGISGNVYTYARFYLKLDNSFVLGGSSPYRLEICKFGPGSAPITLELELNEPPSGDGKFKLRASHSVAGTGISSNSIINYGVSQYIDIVYINHASLGGYAIAVDGTIQITNVGYDTSLSGNANYISIGSQSGNIPNINSKMYFDDVRIEASATEDSFIGNYTAGFGQGSVWSKSTITDTASKYYLSCIFFIPSYHMHLRMEGSALDNPIEVRYHNDGTYGHETKGNDNVTDINIDNLNFNGIYKTSIGFTVDSIGEINIYIESHNSDVDNWVDEILVDNVKLETSNWQTSIDAESNSLLYYPISLKRKGNIYLRVLPEFIYNDTSDHTLISGRAVDASGSIYITHEVYYDATDDKFKFYLTDREGGSVYVESDVYGTADVSKLKTNLNERKIIVCNWDIQKGYMSLIINDDIYENTFNPSILTDFTTSITTFIGSRPDGTAIAECIYDLIRVGEESLTLEQIKIFNGKADPFCRIQNNNVGNVVVKSISFSGVDASDEATIFTEIDSEGNSSLILEIADDFEDKLIIRHQGKDFVTFGSGHMDIDGIIRADVLEINSTTTITTFDDHVTVRFGFAGTPTEFNDGYFEVERGTETNSEFRFDESQDSWIFNNGTNNNISIDNIHIGTWKNDSDFNLVSNGSGSITFSTGSSTDGGGGDGTQNRTDGTERLKISPVSSIFNDDGLDYNFRIESLNNEYMFYVDASEDTVLIGRQTTVPSAGPLVVNSNITIQQGDDLSYGYIEFRNNTGDRSGYIGNGNGSTTWEIISEIDTLNIQGDNLDFNFLSDISISANQITLDTDTLIGTSKTIAWTSDTTNSKLEYTDDAVNFANEAADGTAQVAEITCVGDTARSLSSKYWNLNSVNQEYYIWHYIDDGQVEITEITCTADTAGSLSGKYWYINSPFNEYYVWYHLDAKEEITTVECDTGTNCLGKYWTISSPEGDFYIWYDEVGLTQTDPALPGRLGLRVVVTAADSSDTVASATQAVINARPEFSVPSPGADIIVITNVTAGSVSDASNAGSGAVSVTVTQQGINESDNPNKTGYSEIKVDLSYSDSANNVANKTATAINLSADFTTSFLASVVTVNNVNVGNINDATDFNAGISVNVTQQGTNASLDPGDPGSVGENENTTVTCLPDISKSLSGKYWTLNSKYNQYYVWYNIYGEQQTFTCSIASNAGDVQFGTYWTFDTPTKSYYVWYDDINYNYTDPKLSGKYGVRIEILSADSESNINVKTASKLNLLDEINSDYNVTAASLLYVECVDRGDATNPTAGTTNFSTALTITKDGVNDSTNPNIANRTGIEIIIEEDDLVATVAEKTKLILDAMYEFNVTFTSGSVYIINAQRSEVLDATNGNSGFSISVTNQGQNITSGGTAVGVGIKITITENEGSDDIAIKTKNAIDALSDFSASYVSSTVTITNTHKGEVDDPTEGDSGISVNVTTPSSSGNSRIHGIGISGAFAAHRIYNAAWNDLAEGFDVADSSEKKPGFVYIMTEDGIKLSNKRADKAVVGVYSDTYGFCLGSGGISISESRLPIGLSGKVRVWVKEELEIGDMLVSDIDGFATKATDEERKDRGIIIGKVIQTSKDKTRKRIWILI
jgi:hypothetical protein